MTLIQRLSFFRLIFLVFLSMRKGIPLCAVPMSRACTCSSHFALLPALVLVVRCRNHKEAVLPCPLSETTCS